MPNTRRLGRSISQTGKNIWPFGINELKPVGLVSASLSAPPTPSLPNYRSNPGALFLWAVPEGLWGKIRLSSPEELLAEEPQRCKNTRKPPQEPPRPQAQLPIRL